MYTIDRWASLHRAKGARGTPRVVREMLGLHPDDSVGYYRNSQGRPELRPAANISERLDINECSVKAIGTGIFGYEVFNKLFDPSNRITASVMEDVAGIDPSVFSNINAFTGVVSGMMEVKILEGYNEVMQVADQLVQIEQSQVFGERKKIGIASFLDQARVRLPNEQHPRATLAERWVTIPETSERALGIDFTREAAFLDQTGDLLGAGPRIGEAVAYPRAMQIYDMLLGVTNTYSYKGTTYNTYQTAAGTPPAPNNYVNSIANPITDELTMTELVYAQFATQKDPTSNVPLLIVPKTVIVMPAKAVRMAHILNSTQLRIADGSATPYVSQYTPATFAGGLMPTPTIVSSPWIYKRVTDTDGLALSGASATGLTYWGDFQRAFGYSENWGLNVQSASATDYQLLDQGLVASYFANERGRAFTKDPRYVLKCTNS